MRGEVTCDLFSVLSGGDECPAVEAWPPFEKGDGVVVFVEQVDRGFIVVACHDPADEAGTGLDHMNVCVLIMVVSFEPFSPLLSQKPSTPTTTNQPVLMYISKSFDISIQDGTGDAGWVHQFKIF